MEIPEVVILRLPMYVRALKQINKTDFKLVSSQELGKLLSITPAQIRKDLSYFGRFGKQGRGYNVNYLLDELKQVLKLDKQWNACIIGIGTLGRAIIRYPGFGPAGFDIVAAFDSNINLVGQPIRKGLIIQPITELCSTIKTNNVSIGIVAVPAENAQAVIDSLASCGVKAILNYAPISPFTHNGIVIRNIDPTLALQSMTYYLD
jgi:redox-sensing transcriptional repressor